MMSICAIVVLICAIVFGLIASLCMIIAVSTDYWEVSTFNKDKLLAIPEVNVNESTLNEDEQLYRMVWTESFPNGTNRDNVQYLRSTYGGIWRLCDKISSSYRSSEEFLTFLDEVPYFNHSCFRYIPDYQHWKDYFNDNGTWLVRVQTSAASCNIVCLLSLFTAALTGLFGLFQRQVSACMVTGVMYFVAGVFNCFALIYMHTKVNYMSGDCYSLDIITKQSSFCDCRDVSTGWSLRVAWVSFVFVFFACGFWLYLARCLRLEKAKCML